MGCRRNELRRSARRLVPGDAGPGDAGSIGRFLYFRGCLKSARWIKLKPVLKEKLDVAWAAPVHLPPQLPFLAISMVNCRREEEVGHGEEAAAPQGLVTLTTLFRHPFLCSVSGAVQNKEVNRIMRWCLSPVRRWSRQEPLPLLSAQGTVHTKHTSVQ